MTEKDQARLEELRQKRTELYEEHKSDFDFVNTIGKKAELKTGRLLLAALVAFVVLVGTVWGVYAVRSTAENKVTENNRRIALLRQVINGPTSSSPASSEPAEEEGQTEESQTEEGQTEEGQTEEGQTEEGQTEEGQTEESQTEESQTEEGQTEEGQTEEGETEEGETEEKPVASEAEELPDVTPAEAQEEIAVLNDENKALKDRAELNPMLLWLPVAIPVLAAAAYIVVCLHRSEKYTEYHDQLVADMGDVSMRLFEYDQEIEKLENKSDEEE